MNNKSGYLISKILLSVWWLSILVLPVFDHPAKQTNFATLTTITATNAAHMEPITTIGFLPSAGQIAWSPHGDTLAVATVAGVSLYDPISLSDAPRILRTESDQNSIYSVAFNPTSDILAGGDYEGVVHVWNVGNGKEITTFKGNDDLISNLAFSADGKILASSDSSTVRIWDYKLGTQIISLKTSADYISAGVVFSPIGNSIAFGTNDGLIHIVDAATGTEQMSLNEGAIVNSLAFSPDGSILIAGISNYVTLWDIKRGLRIFDVPMSSGGPIYAVKFSNDGTLASGSATGSVRLLDIHTLMELNDLKGHVREVVSLTFSPDGRTLVSRSEDGVLYFWDTKSGNETATLSLGSIESIVFNSVGDTIVSAHTDGMIRLWDVGMGKEINALKVANGAAMTVVLSPDGTLLASASGGSYAEGESDSVIQIWDFATGKEKSRFNQPERIRGLAFSPDGTILVATAENNLRLIDVQSGKELTVLQGHSHLVTSVAYSVNGLIASGSEDQTIRLWDSKAQNELGILNGDDGSVTSIAFSPNGLLLASTSSSSEKATVKLWDVKTTQKINELSGAGQVRFNVDGTVLTYRGDDELIHLWDVNKAEGIAALEDSGGPSSPIAFSPDGKLFASLVYGGSIRLWGVMAKA